MLLLTQETYPRLRLTYGGDDTFRGEEEIDVEQFVGIKSFKAKGKRLTTYTLGQVEELPPLRQPEPEQEVAADRQEETEPDENMDADINKSDDELKDEILGQGRLF